MAARSLRAAVGEVRRETGSDRRALQAVARAMGERRSLPVSVDWPHCGAVDRLTGLLDRDDALSAIYQALNAPALEAAYRATARDGRKFDAGEIPAVTGLFTPGWVAGFLLENTLGKCPPATRAKYLRLLDPACGTMNFGLVAVDLLRCRYRDEMDRAGRPDWPAEPSVCDERDIDAAI